MKEALIDCYHSSKSLLNMISNKESKSTLHSNNSNNKSNWLADPINQAIYDCGCGLFMSFLVTAKIYTFSILIFQIPAITMMRTSATSSAAIGVIIMAIILITKSRYPYVVIVPDMFSAPYIIQMSYTLANKINDDDEALKATFLLLLFLVISLSATLHILMSMFRLLRFAEFLPYSVFCGLFSAVGMTIVQRSILFAPGYQIIATMAVAILLSLKIIRQKETRPAMSFVAIVIVSVTVFYIVCYKLNYSVDDLRLIGWLVQAPITSNDFSSQVVPWMLWTKGSANINFQKIRFFVLVTECGKDICLLLILIALRRTMQLTNITRLFACRAKTNHELALHGYSQLFTVVLGTFGGIYSGPDMVRVKRMHGGEILPGIVTVFCLIFITLGNFKGVDYIPKFVYMGILASEGFMMLDRFLIMPYRLAGPMEWIAVVIIAVVAFFDIFRGFFLGTAISLLLYSIRFYRTGCIKLTGTGLTIRSTVDRSDSTADWLSSHGEKIRVIQLRGTVAFANAATVLDIVADMLEMNVDKSHPERSAQGRFLVWASSLKTRIIAIIRNYTTNNDLKYLDNIENEDSTLELVNENVDLENGDKHNKESVIMKRKEHTHTTMINDKENMMKGNTKENTRVRTKLEDLFSPLEDQNYSNGAAIQNDDSQDTDCGSDISKASSNHTYSVDFANITTTQKKNSIHEVNDDIEENITIHEQVTAVTQSQSVLSYDDDYNSNSDQLPLSNDPADDFFRPEFLVVDMALVVGVDASALDTFKQIADHCARANVEMCLSGMEPHLDLLERAGVFLKTNRFADLDSALSSCEDKLLERHGVNSAIQKSYITNTDNVYDPRKGFLYCLEIMQDRHNLDDSSIKILRQLVDYVQPLELVNGDVIMDTTQGSPIDLDEDGLYFLESGSVTVQRDPSQSLLLTVRSNRRKRMSVAPRVLRLKHRTFQLSRLGPGWLVGATELCSGFRSMGQFVVQSPECKAHFLPFRVISTLEKENPILGLKLVQLAAAVVADRYDRSKEQLAHLIDTVYSPPIKVSTATEKALKKAHFAFERVSNYNPLNEKNK